MAKEVSTAARSSGTGPGVFSAYKRTQGRRARQATFLAIVIAMAVGAWSLHQTFVDERPDSVAIGVPAALLAVGVFVAYRIVNWPRFADFLIAVEAEMVKVTWPARAELFRSAVVVILTIFGLAVLLFGYDMIWRSVLSLIFGS